MATSIFTEMSLFCHWIGVKFVRIAGMIVEYNPLHSGHLHLLEETRRRLGSGTAIVCAMSGNFVQRGDFALVRKHQRARAAVESGADLVLELPLPWAVSSAETFADGGVQVLSATGVVTDLAFGSEIGEAAPLMELAGCLLSPAYPKELRRMVLWAYLGLTPADVPETVPYLRPLAANETGRRLLARMRQSAAVPILTKPADGRTLGAEARRLLALEAQATDLYTLAYPDLSAARGGGEWREGPVILGGHAPF